MPRKPTKKTAKRKAWEAMSLYIRQKHADSDGYVKCVSCPTISHWKEMDAAHFIPRGRSEALMFVEENVWPACPRCNRFDTERHMIGYTIHMVNTYGEDFVRALQENRETVRRRTADYEAIELGFKEALEDLLREGPLRENRSVGMPDLRISHGSA